MRVAAAIILAAMPEEIQPFLDRAKEVNAHVGKLATPGNFSAWSIDLIAPRILLVQTGIGMTAAASAATWALEQVSTRELMMSGSAGGLGEAHVGDVIIGDTYRYALADARAFDYAFGQVPGQPAEFTGSAPMLEASTRLDGSIPVKTGLILSSNSFISGGKLDEVKEHAGHALAVDMESVAVAQVAHSYGVNFTSIRGISDMCGPNAGLDHTLTLNDVASRAADVTLTLADSLAQFGRSSERKRRSFSVDALTAALYTMIALDHDAEPGNVEELDLDLSDLHRDLRDSQVQHFAGLVAAGQEIVRNNSAVKITSQRYDQLRNDVLQELDLAGGRGRQMWPPTSQTVMKRFSGLWNNALKSIGLEGSSGRRPGGLKYTDEDYRSAIQKYTDWANDNGKKPSYAGYQNWLKKQTGPTPSGASVRQHFGSWAEAVLTSYME